MFDIVVFDLFVDIVLYFVSFFFFFFNDTATTEIYTLSLHDALPICGKPAQPEYRPFCSKRCADVRSEEHTSELQSQSNLVCRLLLEKKKQKKYKKKNKEKKEKEQKKNKKKKQK